MAKKQQIATLQSRFYLFFVTDFKAFASELPCFIALPFLWSRSSIKHNMGKIHARLRLWNVHFYKNPENAKKHFPVLPWKGHAALSLTAHQAGEEAVFPGGQFPDFCHDTQQRVRSGNFLQSDSVDSSISSTCTYIACDVLVLSLRYFYLFF